MNSKEALEFIKLDYGVEPQGYEIIKHDLDRLNLIELGLDDLFRNHIEFVCEKSANGNDVCYFKIKNSKGKEKSFTSKTFEDFWKEVIGK